MKKNYNKKVILAVLLVALLIAVVGGVTYAFFNFMSSFILCLVLISNPNKIRELEEKN